MVRLAIRSASLLLSVGLILASNSTSAAPPEHCKQLAVRFATDDPMDPQDLAKLRTCVSDEIRSREPRKAGGGGLSRNPGPALKREQ